MFKSDGQKSLTPHKSPIHSSFGGWLFGRGSANSNRIALLFHVIHWLSISGEQFPVNKKRGELVGSPQFFLSFAIVATSR